ncbi:5,6-dimethylbenzimidazole synthase [Fodinicurvata sp. EGI_FJ10296]|jgi:5,6-dimethylbenzimidazole synthase|uniref:5,6-dimethylbenzimidazole synthase n=1 Tax=Fodinicurvata sp. EGI_FJ10296 TaxID=3231908 RepID=UPI0034553432
MSTEDPNRFSVSEREGLFKAIRERRDVRSEFLADPIAPDVLVRLLRAAHHAPSVGLMQPWDFILIDDVELRRSVKAIFDDENEKAARNYQNDRGADYRRLKLEGILESPINLCVTCDRSRGGPHVLGRNSIFDTDIFSVCLGIQNLWLTARAEGLGVGWVSILDQTRLATALDLPDEVYPVAYLCIGYVSEFRDRPELEAKGWRRRLPLGDLVHANGWGRKPTDPSIAAAIEESGPLSTSASKGRVSG